MTKPNYRGLITATFTKPITAKRRYALQVIHYFGISPHTGLPVLNV